MELAPSTRRRPAGGLAVLVALVVPVLVAACGDAPPSPSATPGPTPAPTATPAPVIDLPIPGDDTATAQVLLRSADGAYDLYASIGQLQGASSTCTAVLLDTGESPTAPAYAITNGHCVGIFGANELVVDRAAEGISVAFDWFIDRPEHRVVPVTKVAWASMKTTDLAVLELAATPDELRGVGLRGWRPQAVEGGAGTSVDVVMVGVPVGAPVVDIPADQRYLRLGTCSLDVTPAVINERQWLWPHALRNDCPEVVPGNSGSAVLDRATGGLLGLINTTTYKGEAGAECWLGRPCEINEDGEASLPDTSYAQPVGGLGACFSDTGRLTLGGGCPLDPGGGVTSLDGAPLAVNPATSDPLTGKPSPTTWSTTVVTASPTTYRYKIGPLDGTACADEAGYSAPIASTIPIDDDLPTTEQRLLLCAVAEGSAPADAAIAVAYIDTTPPAADIAFAVSGSKAEGWRIEPVFSPPELSLYLVKVGPAKTTDCADPDGYVAYRRSPVNVPGDDAPARFCAIGYDDASNASEPAFRVLR
jgi:hypothetical protein